MWGNVIWTLQRLLFNYGTTLEQFNFYYMYMLNLNKKLLLPVGHRNTGTPVLSESSGHLLETDFVLKYSLQLSLRSF